MTVLSTCKTKMIYVLAYKNNNLLHVVFSNSNLVHWRREVGRQVELTFQLYSYLRMAEVHAN